MPEIKFLTLAGVVATVAVAAIAGIASAAVTAAVFAAMGLIYAGLWRKDPVRDEEGLVAWGVAQVLATTLSAFFATIVGVSPEYLPLIVTAGSCAATVTWMASYGS